MRFACPALREISVSGNGALVNHLVLGTTHPPAPNASWSFRTKDLADDPRQVFEFKAVADKVFINQYLTSRFRHFPGSWDVRIKTLRLARRGLGQSGGDDLA
jgi:hypothetical protein